MSKSEIKAAMESLQVSKPFRMPARAPSFTPPSVENSTPVVKPTEVEEATQVLAATPAQKPTQVQDPTRVSGETPVEKPTEVLIPTQVGKPTQVANGCDEESESSATLGRRVTEQDSSVVLEARAADGLEKGYTRVPNSVLMQLAGGDFTRSEIKLALLIARFTISFQRKLAPLSKTVLERRSGLRGPAVLEGLAGLVAKGLVEKQQGDQHRPNMLGLVLPEGWDDLIKSKREEAAETSVGKATPVANRTPVEKPTSAPVEKLTPAGVGNPTYFKDIKTIENKISLSGEPSGIEKYFAGIGAPRKRETERKAFVGLKERFREEDILKAVGFVQTHGTLEKQEPCHSPMAYLSAAMGEVLSASQEREEKGLVQQEKREREARSLENKRQCEEEERLDLESREKEFLKAFPTQEAQLAVLGKFGVRLPGIDPEGPIAHGLAMGRWWDSQRKPKT